MFDDHMPTGLPTTLTSSHFFATLACTLMLIPIPVASLQGQPMEATAEQIAETPTDSSGPSITGQDIDEDRAELSVLEQELSSVRTENAELAERLEARQLAHQKTSEQLEAARTELTTAQQQLAASQNEKGNISALLKQVQKDLDAIRKLANDKEQTVQALRRELAQLAQTNQDQTSEIQNLQTTIGNQREQMTGASREIATLELNIEKANLELQRLGSRIEKMKREIESLRMDGQQVRQRATELQTRYDALRAEIPKTEGGTASEAQLQDAGAKALSRLREQARKLHVRPSDPAIVRAYQDAVKGLAMKQQMLALATRARGLYRVRAKDTLAIVAKRNYGETHKWTQVFDANRHILDDPDRLMPDMTLLIP